MANSVTDILRDTLVSALQDDDQSKKNGGGGGTGKGILAGAALAAAAPLVKRGVEAARSGELDDLMSKLGTGEALKDVRSRFADDDDESDTEQPEAREDAEGDEPEAQDGSDDQDEDREPAGGAKATGKGRRMPVQQSIDVGVPLETAYNQFTQFEDWTEFMHRVTRVTSEDPCTVSFATKIWGKTKEFQAKVVTQIPDERLKWRVSQGITHTGIVTFHELAPRLTRIELTMDVDPGSMLEKAARGMRLVKRAARADLHRFKAFIEMQEQETGAWRGVIIDGELVEDHDPSYDEEREYSDIEDAKAEGEDDEQEEQEEPEAASDEDEAEDEEEKPAKPRRRRQREKTPAPA